MLKRKSIDYYSKTKYDIGYVSSRLEINVLQEDSSESTLAQLSLQSSHDSDFGLRMFKKMSVKMTSISIDPNEEEPDY